MLGCDINWYVMLVSSIYLFDSSDKNIAGVTFLLLGCSKYKRSSFLCFCFWAPYVLKWYSSKNFFSGIIPAQ
jgi:hypothetical protein